jgi:hypothetical protein
MVCGKCGCSDYRACVFVRNGHVVATCYWIAEELCSACEGTWLHPSDQLALARPHVVGGAAPRLRGAISRRKDPQMVVRLLERARRAAHSRPRAVAQRRRARGRR